jgi:site-specific DNA recombinase
LIATFLLRFLLRNPAYMGQAAYRKTQAVARNRPTKSAHDHRYYPTVVHSSARQRPKADWIGIPVPRIISPRLFARASRQLEANKRQASRNNLTLPIRDFSEHSCTFLVCTA